MGSIQSIVPYLGPWRNDTQSSSGMAPSSVVSKPTAARESTNYAM